MTENPVIICRARISCRTCHEIRPTVKTSMSESEALRLIAANDARRDALSALERMPPVSIPEKAAEDCLNCDYKSPRIYDEYNKK